MEVTLWRPDGLQTGPVRVAGALKEEAILVSPCVETVAGEIEKAEIEGPA